MHLHPRSVQLTSRYAHQSQIEPFNNYGHGTAVWSDLEVSEFEACVLHRHFTALIVLLILHPCVFDAPQFQDKVETDLHFFAEECDSLLGFQIFAETNSGFGGLTAAALSMIADEYSTKSRLLFALEPQRPQNTQPDDEVNGHAESSVVRLVT